MIASKELYTSTSSNPYLNYCAFRLENESDDWDEDDWASFFTESLALLANTSENPQ
jgi:hypothetical protein